MTSLHQHRQCVQHNVTVCLSNNNVDNNSTNKIVLSSWPGHC